MTTPSRCINIDMWGAGRPIARCKCVSASMDSEAGCSLIYSLYSDMKHVLHQVNAGTFCSGVLTSSLEPSPDAETLNPQTREVLLWCTHFVSRAESRRENAHNFSIHRPGKFCSGVLTSFLEPSPGETAPTIARACPCCLEHTVRLEPLR
jgi:hypothetical protein